MTAHNPNAAFNILDLGDNDAFHFTDDITTSLNQWMAQMKTHAPTTHRAFIFDSLFDSTSSFAFNFEGHGALSLPSHGGATATVQNHEGLSTSAVEPMTPSHPQDKPVSHVEPMLPPATVVHIIEPANPPAHATDTGPNPHVEPMNPPTPEPQKPGWDDTDMRPVPVDLSHNPHVEPMLPPATVIHIVEPANPPAPVLWNTPNDEWRPGAVNIVEGDPKDHKPVVTPTSPVGHLGTTPNDGPPHVEPMTPPAHADGDPVTPSWDEDNTIDCRNFRVVTDSQGRAPVTDITHGEVDRGWHGANPNNPLVGHHVDIDVDWHGAPDSHVVTADVSHLVHVDLFGM